MIVDATQLDAAHAYKLLIGSIIPRAIAWVSTRSADGVDNLAPVSFFTAVGRKPPKVSLSLQPRSDGVTLKDTFVNIRDTGEFVVNIATLPQADVVHRSAFEFDSEVDEFEALGLAKDSCEVVRAPRVKESPISLECVLDRIFAAEQGNDHVVWGQVVRFHIRDELYLDRGRIDTGAIPVFGRLAAEYNLVDNIFTTPLEQDVLEARQGRRMARLDGEPDDYSPIDTAGWSPSGSTRA
ncbi:flavin reductase family protein [Nocardia sp. NPDC057455]|uniref:flavin reductase family protein n=1 Tax=Nocardia sp. NPDC057455 TaxID=3346138 RepID=UPI00366F00A5